MMIVPVGISTSSLLTCTSNLILPQFDLWLKYAGSIALISCDAQQCDCLVRESCIPCGQTYGSSRLSPLLTVPVPFKLCLPPHRRGASSWPLKYAKTCTVTAAKFGCRRTNYIHHDSLLPRSVSSTRPEGVRACSPSRYVNLCWVKIGVKYASKVVNRWSTSAMTGQTEMHTEVKVRPVALRYCRNDNSGRSACKATPRTTTMVTKGNYSFWLKVTRILGDWSIFISCDYYRLWTDSTSISGQRIQWCSKLLCWWGTIF